MTRSAGMAKQRGVVLLIALVALIAMTLAAIAVVRSVDTTNIIAGNMAFQQAATHSADIGVETAIAWLQNGAQAGTLNDDDATNGYAANGNTIKPQAGQSWNDFWQASLSARAVSAGTDGAGNAIQYVIDRLCDNAGAPTGGAGCVQSPVSAVASGNAEEAGEVPLEAPSVTYYRITVRVTGPKNTVGYVQAVVSM